MNFFSNKTHGAPWDTPPAGEVFSPPQPQLELPGAHRLVHIDTRFREPLQMLFPLLRIHDVRSLFAPVEAIFEERAKHSVLLVNIVKESANMTDRKSVV